MQIAATVEIILGTCQASQEAEVFIFLLLAGMVQLPYVAAKFDLWKSQKQLKHRCLLMRSRLGLGGTKLTSLNLAGGSTLLRSRMRMRSSPLGAGAFMGAGAEACTCAPAQGAADWGTQTRCLGSFQVALMVPHYLSRLAMLR